MAYALCLLAGLAVGGVAAWLWASARVRAAAAVTAGELQARAAALEAVVHEREQQAAAERQTVEVLRSSLEAERDARVQAETRLDETVKSLEEQKRLLEEAKAKLTDAFKALSGDALKSNNEAFLALARKTLEAVVADAKGDIGKRQEAIDALIKPLSESLKKYEEHAAALEASRQKAYGSLEEQLKSLVTTQQQLQKETGNLVTALRKPGVRGRWGELTLHRVVEMAGLVEHCDFVEQESREADGQRLRPDLVVHLPAGRQIVVDSKTSLEAYLDALSAENEEARKDILTRHARQVRTHMDQLAAKAYWEQFREAPEFVVMFIPGESFLAAAVDHDPTLIEDGMMKRVVIATPTTLIALLRAVAYGWRQEQIAANAQAISDLGKDLHERLRTLVDHLVRVGKSLGNATEAYNKAVGSLENRVLPAARRFKELRAATGDDIPPLEPIDSTPRLLEPPPNVDGGA